MLSKNEIKYIQSLGHKKGRDLEAVFIVEGKKILHEVLTDFPHLLIRLYGTASFFEENSLQEEEHRMVLVTETELERISQLQTPQQVVAILKKKPEVAFDEKERKWVLALDAIRDPGNMGTILRIADWFGIKQILCSTDCADVYNPKTVQASMGSILRVNMIEGELSQLLHKAKLPVYAATLKGIPAQKISFHEPGILLIGNEARGVGDVLLPFVTHQVSIPSFGAAESLNAAVAAGILLWEIKRGV